MAGQPSVSVILIFLNEARFVAEAVASVFAQTYVDWELLLVDDGSTDDSSHIARQVAADHPGRAVYLDHPGHVNHGMSATRNLGLEHARGRFVTFLDADDVWYPDKLRVQVDALSRHPEAAAVVGRLEYWHSWNATDKNKPDFVAPLHEPLDMVVAPPALLRVTLQDEWVTLSNLLVRREVVEALGRYETRFRGLYEDQVFHAKLCLDQWIVTSSHIGYRYRQHPKSCVHQTAVPGRKRQERLRFLDWLDGYLDMRNSTDLELRRIINDIRLSVRYPRLSRWRNVLGSVFGTGQKPTSRCSRS